MNECKEVSSVFSSINFAIKSVADNAFSENKDLSIKERALTQLFKNLSSNVGETFKRWRDLNNIEKLRQTFDKSKKATLINILENLINNGKNGQIRNAISKFRTNRKIVEIQRNFLKRLLLSKAGMVAIALRKIQALPERIDRPLYEKANKFEKGLSAFAEKTLRQSFAAFKS